MKSDFDSTLKVEVLRELYYGFELIVKFSLIWTKSIEIGELLMIQNIKNMT